MNAYQTKAYSVSSKRLFFLPEFYGISKQKKETLVPINCNLYAYGANNPVHYIDPDGNDIINASRQLMQDAGDATLGSSSTKIKDEGCVLTAYTRMASAIIGRDISLAEANQIGVDNGLFTGTDGNLLTPENGAALVNAILKENGITDTTISFDGSYEGQDAVTKYQDSNSSESKYFSTIRVGTHDAKGNKYDHTMNLDKDAYIFSNCGDNIKLNDTSGVRSQLADDPSGRKNTFKRMDFFKINTTQSNSQE